MIDENLGIQAFLTISASRFHKIAVHNKQCGSFVSIPWVGSSRSGNRATGRIYCGLGIAL